MKAYVVMAYRWGSTNDHSYIVCVTADREKAVRMADNEPEWRGGKYGAAVHEDDEATNDNLERMALPPVVHYAPSLFGETEPRHNHRIDAIEAMGHELMRAVEDEPEGKEWAVEIIRIQTERGDRMQKAADDYAAKEKGEG